MKGKLVKKGTGKPTGQKGKLIRKIGPYKKSPKPWRIAYKKTKKS